jgi:hypothetical protein
LLRHGGKGFGSRIECKRMQKRYSAVKIRLDISNAGDGKVHLPEPISASHLSLHQPWSCPEHQHNEIQP